MLKEQSDFCGNIGLAPRVEIERNGEVMEGVSSFSCRDVCSCYSEGSSQDDLMDSIFECNKKN